MSGMNIVWNINYYRYLIKNVNENRGKETGSYFRLKTLLKETL